jgi:hypothetical protein
MKVKIIYVIIIVNLFDIGFVHGQNYRKRETEIPQVVCFGSHKTKKSFVPPPAEFLLKSGAEKKSDIIVSYSLFPSEAKEAFEYAVSIWESLIESEVPIYVEARWRSMERGALGGASPNDYVANFENAPRKNYYYPIAVVEKITKTELSGSSFPDITATFNKDSKWYFGTDGNTPELLYDFVSVVLHEIGHGLGFHGFFLVTGNTGLYARTGGDVGDVSAYDLMVVNHKNQMLADTNYFEIPSENLYSALTSKLLYSSSPVATANNGNVKPSIYAPTEWNSGSSIYHLDYVYYPHSNENSLMTHAIAPGEAIHDPGPITMGILEDIGWKVFNLDFHKPKDTEQKRPITFNLSIESDYKVEANSIYVYYSYDGFQNNKDSMLLTYNLESGLFSATLNPVFETGKIDYYLSARDRKNRVAFVPTEAPGEIYSITIGPDNEPPVINHDPIPYFIAQGKSLTISTNADDNLGLDSVYAEIWVNDLKQESLELIKDSTDMYSGIFNYDPTLFNDGDEIKYRITALDSSIAKNKTVSPENDFFSFQIEKIFEPADGYYSDFNIKSRDFIISDFDIYTAKTFENGSLHSPHPYKSPNQNNSNFNFSTLLKYPIVLNENSIMSFDEIVLVEPGEVLSKFGDDNFWDYVIVEGSNDNGTTWLPLADGYDSGAYPTWKTSYNQNIDNNNSSKTIGTPDLYISRQINLTENGNFKPNDTILIRFRLFSDPYANGWGWAIDNLRIQTPVSAPIVTLSPGNIMVYPNPVNNILNVIIDAENNIKDLSIDIFNIYGQKLKSIQEKNVLGEFKVETELRGLNSGMYLLVVTENGNQVYSKKIIRN